MFEVRRRDAQLRHPLEYAKARCTGAPQTVASEPEGAESGQEGSAGDQSLFRRCELLVIQDACIPQLREFG